MAPLVVIVGPTASGKTGAAIALAEKYDGEIICADSRTIYKGMDIGTAKPSLEEQARVPHWGLDLVQPGERFTAADFKRYAVEKIDEIRARGKVPFLVGGTGLYVDAVVLDYQFGPPADPAIRAKFEEKTLEELHKYCLENNITIPENSKNKRYVIRAIEQSTSATTSESSPIDNTIIVGIATDNKVLRQRMVERASAMLEEGVLDETDRLVEQFGWEGEAMTGNVYRIIRRHRQGELSEQEMLEKFATADWHLAKRQLTWLRRRDFIHWLPLEQVVPYLSKQLSTMTKS